MSAEANHSRFAAATLLGNLGKRRVGCLFGMLEQPQGNPLFGRAQAWDEILYTVEHVVKLQQITTDFHENWQFGIYT